MTAYNFSGGIMSPNTSGLFSLGSLSGTGTLTTGTGQNFSIGALGTDTTYGGTIAGSGSIAKTGGGTLTLSGTVSNSGGITVSNGTLLVANAASGPVTVNSGGTLGGNGLISGATTIQSGGMLAPGTNSIGTLRFSSSLALVAGCTSIFGVSHSPLTNDIANVLGALTNGGTLIVSNTGAAALAAGDSFKLFSAGTYAGAFATLSLPLLTNNLGWNTRTLATNGIISVAALSAPVISGITASNGNLQVRGTGGTTNWPYYVLRTTNLATAWAPVATNFFDASGNFNLTLTNAAGPGPSQAFYRLQLQ
jgi:autotransporter-associated beta strand protein